MSHDPQVMKQLLRETRQKPVEALYPHDRGAHCPACYICGWCGREYHGGLCPCNSRDPLLAESVGNQQFGRIQ